MDGYMPSGCKSCLTGFLIYRHTSAAGGYWHEATNKVFAIKQQNFRRWIWWSVWVTVIVTKSGNCWNDISAISQSISQSFIQSSYESVNKKNWNKQISYGGETARRILCVRLTSSFVRIFAKWQNRVFQLPYYGDFGCNVGSSFLALWRARRRLYINDNWTFSLSLTAEARAYISVELSAFWRGWITSKLHVMLKMCVSYQHL